MPEADIPFQRSAEEVLKLQQERLEVRSRLPVPARPGDGVCPTKVESVQAALRSQALWQALVDDDANDISTEKSSHELEGLFHNIPQFCPPSPSQLQIEDRGGGALLVECISEWSTSNHQDCDQKTKSIKHYQTLGFSEPVVCHITEDGHVGPPQAPSTLYDIRHLSALMIAWSYILSSRWVEILKAAGKEAHLYQHEEIHKGNFWHVITKCPWQAVVIHTGNRYFPRWQSLRCEGVLGYVNTLSLSKTYMKIIS